MILIYLLKWLGVIDPKRTVLRRGVANFAVYSILAVVLFVGGVFTLHGLGVIN